MPSAGKQILAAAVLAAVVLVAGLVALVAGTLFGGARDSGGSEPVSAVTTPRATVTVTAPPRPLMTTTPSPTDSPRSSATSSDDSSEETPEPDATAFDELGETPWTDRGVEFGFITRARTRDGVLQLTVNPARFIGGQEAVRANGGVAPDNDYLIVDDSAETRTYTVDADAVLVGTDVLDSDDDPTSANRVSRTQLRDRATDAVDAGRFPMVWLRHATAGDPASPVTYLQEQYTP